MAAIQIILLISIPIQAFLVGYNLKSLIEAERASKKEIFVRKNYNGN